MNVLEINLTSAKNATLLSHEHAMQKSICELILERNPSNVQNMTLLAHKKVI